MHPLVANLVKFSVAFSFVSMKQLATLFMGCHLFKVGVPGDPKILYIFGQPWALSLTAVRKKKKERAQFSF